MCIHNKCKIISLFNKTLITIDIFDYSTVIFFAVIRILPARVYTYYKYTASIGNKFHRKAMGAKHVITNVASETVAPHLFVAHSHNRCITD